MDPQYVQLRVFRNHVSYPTLTAVVRYFPFHTRRILVKRSLLIRKINKKIPIHFDHVEIIWKNDELRLKLDHITWVFSAKDRTVFYSDLDRKNQYFVPDTWIYLGLHLSYYLNRMDITIGRLLLENVTMPSEMTAVKRINNLKFTQKGTSDELVDLRAFSNTIIGSMEINIDRGNIEWISTLSVMKTKSATINFESTDKSPADFDSLTFPVLKLSGQMSKEVFLHICKSLKNNTFERGSSCRAVFLNDNDRFWKNLQAELGVNILRRDFFISRFKNENNELMLRKSKHDGNSYAIEATVCDSGAGFLALPKRHRFIRWIEDTFHFLLFHFNRRPLMCLALYLLFFECFYTFLDTFPYVASLISMLPLNIRIPILIIQVVMDPLPRPQPTMSTTFTHSLEPPDPSDFLGTLTIAQLVCGLLTHLGCSLGLIIYIIYKKLYKLAFYKILIVNLIVNFFIWLNTWPGYRLLLFPGGIDMLKGLITLFPWSLTFFRFMFNPFLIIQFFLTFGTNLNSILVLRSKLQYLKYATRCFWGYMAFTVVVSFAPSLTILNFFGGHSAEVMLVNHTLTEVVNREVIKKHVFTSMVSSFVYFLLSFSSTVYIVMALKNQSRNASSHSNAKKLNPWKVFVFQCILHFSVFLWSSVSYALFDDPMFSKYRLECLMLVSDITTVLPPYAYAIIDRNIRGPLMKKLRPKKVSTVYVYAVPAQQTASALVVVRPSAARSSSSVLPN